MAQLKSTVVAGSLRVTDTTYTNDLVINATKTARYVLAAPTSNGAPTFRALTNADVGLGNVENTKLSTWAGSSNITTLGTIATGTWNATAIAVAKGGTGATTAANARTNLGLGSIATYGAATAGTKDTWGLVPVIGDSDGVMEVGKYIDFHTTDGNTADYDVRITAATTGLTITGTTSGTFSGSLSGNATSATKLATAREIYVDLSTTRNTSSKVTFDGQADKAIHVSGTLPVARGGTGLTTSTNVNAVIIGNSSAATNAFQAVATASGAFYAATANGKPTFGKLPIAQGGTNATTAADAKANLGLGHIYYGTCASAAGEAKVVTCAEYTKTAPEKGDIIFVTFTATNSLAVGSVTMKVGSNTNAYNVKYINGAADPANMPAVGYLRANQTYMFWFDGTYWVVDIQYDTNSNDTMTGYARDAGSSQTTIKVLNNILYPYVIMLPSGDGQGYYPINASEKDTGTAKTGICAGVFNITQRIYYYSTDANVAVNATVRQDRLWQAYALNLAYSFNTGTTLTVGKDVYMVATLQSPTTAKLRNPGATGTNASAAATGASAGPITQTLPTTDDGFIYILLGRAYTNNMITLALEHPIYWYKNGAIGRYTAEAYDAGTALPTTNNYNGRLFFQTSNPAYELPTAGNAGAVLVKTDANSRNCTWQTAPAVLDARYVKKAGDTMTGQLTINGNILVDRTAAAVEGTIRTQSVAGSIYLYSTGTASGNRGIYGVNNGGTGQGIMTVDQNGYVTFIRAYGAVWNDYAEFRRDNQHEKGKQKPGHCVVETGTGTLALSTKRLQMGAEIITDTFGFAIGQDEEHHTNTPVAVSGRVLAYPYEGREEFGKHIGRPVCSGPDGTVSIMSHYEERTFPSRIIGTISEVPTYKTWGENNVEVNGRVWIRMR